MQRLLREGGGALAEDIPPASDAERQEGDVSDELDLAAPDPPQLPRPAEPTRGGSSGDILRELLAELEALRALLPD